MKQFALMVAGLAMAASVQAGAVQWETDYDKAIAAAKKDNKLVMVDVYTDWCGPCKMLDRDVYGNADVQAKVARDFVPLKVNPEKSEKGAKLAKQLGTRGYPHIVFLDASGKKIAEALGYRPAKEFSKMLDEIVKKPRK